MIKRWKLVSIGAEVGDCQQKMKCMSCWIFVVGHGRHRMALKAIRLQDQMAILSSFLLLVIATGLRSTALEATVTIGVRRLTRAATTTRTASTSIATISTSTTTTAATVYQCAQS